MSQHTATVTWKRKTPDFAYDTYDRTHDVKFEGVPSPLPSRR